MIKEAIDKIIALAHPEHLTINDHDYTDKPIHLVAPPRPAPLTFKRLAGFAGYIEENRDSIDPKKVIIFVEGPTIVRLLGSLNTADRGRESFSLANYDHAGFPFSDKLHAEDFCIRLQTQFEETPDRDRLAKLVGNMTQEDAVTLADDGITQRVSQRAGVTLIAKTKIDNPFKLAPFRTFPEVAQQLSPFIFRVHQNGAEPLCALYECDNGRWEIECVASIQDWLKKRLARTKIDIPVLA